MARLASLFSSLARGERDPQPEGADEFRAGCDHCGQVTVWKLAANVIGQQVYRCCQCGKAMVGGVKP
jgi:hypothetical protein